jgi:diguanylate cyclase (GGDEF)-like protein
LLAYALMEDAQGEHHRAAFNGLVALEAEARQRAWQDVEFLAAAGQALYALVHSSDRALVAQRMSALTARAEGLGSPALTALALALGAVAAGERGDGAALLADAGQAVVLVADENLDAVDRSTVLVVCAAAYNTLSLWELADDLYDAASALAPFCEIAVQEPAIAMNRILIRLEWATALFELGDEPAALAQLERAATAVAAALTVPNLPPLWQLDVAACRDLLAFVTLAHSDAAAGVVSAEALNSWRAVLADHRIALHEGDDVEMLPLLDAFVVLSLFRLGRRTEAVESARLLGARGSTSSGARSFPLWVRAHVLAGESPNEATSAAREYGVLVARARWNARRGVLAAARSRIASEGLGAEHAQLARDVLLDPLTGLSNRREFDEWLATAPAHGSVAALLLIDLDAFKDVNDVHGHAVGDEVLRRVAKVVTRHVRSHDMALRLGGDEFAVVMTEELNGSMSPSESVDALEEIAVKRARALEAAVADTDYGDLAEGLSVRVSLGVATGLLGPKHPDGAERLYRTADTRLYVAKSEPAAQATPGW